uniref:AAA_28 domain-containing protein n=1 Tax=Syphacia muris TaxID=451379 RepID=A0A0N5ABN0_9BILA
MIETTSRRKIYKVVLTGGPCGGKTTGQSRLRSFFESLGWKVYTVSETATILLGGGVKFEELNYEQAYQFQKDVIHTLLRIESVFFKQAEMSSEDGPPILIICDRGAMDPSAYIDDASWKRMLDDLGLDQFSLRENRYDQIVHMTTAADGAEEYYSLANNYARKESLENAIKQDQKTRSAWLGHPRVDVIDNVGCKSFDDKILKLIAAVCDRMGLPTADRLAFNSKKRKWLVRALDKSAMPHCEVFDVCHHYLCTEDPNVQVRLRSRSQNGRTTYTITTRHFEGPEPVETRMQLTEREYLNYRKMEDRSRAPINKERRCFMFGKQYFHIDIYTDPLPPSCNGHPLMILETYTTAPVGDKNEPQLPSFMTIEREITGDSQYSMYNIANINVNNLSGK